MTSSIVGQSYGVGIIEWNTIGSGQTNYNIEDGAVGGIPITFEIDDNDHAADGSINIITATVTTNTDPVGTTFTLTETTPISGRFMSANMIFMENDARFQITDTAVITIVDDCVPNDGNGNCDPNVVETLTGGADGAIAVSETSDILGNPPVPIHFVETGQNTGIFVGKLKFSTTTTTSDPPPATNVLQVSPGDIITIVDNVSGLLTNGIIMPMSNDKRAVFGSEGGTATVTYTPVSGPAVQSQVTIDAHPPAGGRGSGGLVAPPTLVVDSPSTSGSFNGSGCKGDCTPPTLGVDETYRRIVDSGFSYNDHPVDVELYYTHYPLVTVNVGQENKAILKIYDNSGPQHIAHIEIVFGLGKDQILDESKAGISLDVGMDGKKTISTYDPENVLQDIKIQTTTNRCSSFGSADCLLVTIYHTFRAPLDFNIVATEIWDYDRNSWQNYYNDGITVVGESLNPPKKHIGIYKGHQIELTETSKDKAVDAEGRIWTFDKVWSMDFIPPKKQDRGPTSHGYNRYDVGFARQLEEQITIAKAKLNTMINSRFDDHPTKIVYKQPMNNYISRFEDEDLKSRKEQSILIAEETIKKLYWRFQ
ncbi:MAG TPA: hypothetical protein VNK44_01240 [Candidatus Nitrosotenuis sp.]|nr:hypothetical protein [Candidatus Nitrosotenuis sp.]